MSDNFWDRVRAAKKRRFDLAEYTGFPSEYWVELVPSATLPPSVFERAQGLGESELQRLLFANCVIGWNLVDEDGQPLPLPRESDRWREVLPTGLVVFLARKINEMDREMIEIPPTSGGPS